VGTGIGSAFVYHGVLYRGLGEVHPEGGHQVIDPHGPACYCGAHGCWESLASGTAIGRRAQELITRHGDKSSSILRQLSQDDLAKVDARMVVQAAEAGDPLARQVVEEAGQGLALGLVNLIAFFVPEVILLGGGVMKSYGLFQPVVEAVIARHSVVVPARQVELRPARLGRQAGVVGAGYAILQHLAAQISTPTTGED
jgi:glucokinase